MQYRKALLISKTSGDTTVYTLSAADLKDDGGAHMTKAILSVKQGALNYAFTHNPGIDPADDVTVDTNAMLTINAASGQVVIDGYQNLANLRYTITGNTDVYVVLGA